MGGFLKISAVVLLTESLAGSAGSYVCLQNARLFSVGFGFVR